MRRQIMSDDEHEPDMDQDEDMQNGDASQHEDIAKERIKEEKRKIRQQYRQLITDTEGMPKPLLSILDEFSSMQADTTMESNTED